MMQVGGGLVSRVVGWVAGGNVTWGCPGGGGVDVGGREWGWGG